MVTHAPRVLVIQHADDCPPALLGDWLRDAGCALDVVAADTGAAIPDVTDYDGFLVLGGPMGAGDEASVPWLVPVKEQVRRAAERGVPTLGVCLGHQVVAAALGGEVGVNPRGQQVGLIEVGWTAAADTDVLAASLSGSRRVVHWNHDLVLRLPEGAEILAETAHGEPQVVRYAAGVWGMQGHPEVDVATLRPWAAGDRAEHDQRGLDQDAILRAIDEAAAELEQSWRPLAQRWAAVVGAAT